MSDAARGDAAGPVRQAPPGLRFLVLVLLAGVCINALAYAWRAANPVLVSDTWHFVETLVLPYAEGDFAAGDLLAKRSSTDHSQPLRKLLLLLNYEFFDLDFSIDAVIGVMAAFASLCLLWLVARAGRQGPPGSAHWVLFLGVAAAYLSLGSPVVFSWPLVTTSYTNHPFIILYGWAAWSALVQPSRQRMALVFAAGVLLSVVADDTGLLSTIAIVVAAMVHAISTRSARASVAVALACTGAYVAYALLYALVSTTPEAAGLPGASVGNALARLASDPSGAWAMLNAPMAGSIAHRGDLPGWTNDALAISLATGLLLLAHAWFWWSAFLGRRNAPTFVATAIMLLFYGLFAGVFLARASQYGVEYFWQPRYSIFYRWNLVALFLMALGQISWRSVGAARLRPVHAIAVLAGLVVLVQLPLSIAAWGDLRYIENHQRKQAGQIVEIARNPEVLPDRCNPGVVVCRFNLADRRRILWFLQSQELNVFNERIRARHGLP